MRQLLGPDVVEEYNVCQKRGITIELYPGKPRGCHLRAGQPLETLVAEMVFRECGREDRVGKIQWTWLLQQGTLVAM